MHILHRMFLPLLALAGIAHAEPPPQPMSFACNGAMCFATSEVRIYGPNLCADVGNAIWAQTPFPCSLPPPQTWTTVDLTTFGVPSNAPAVFLSGMLIITQGKTAGTISLQIGMRQYGSTEDPGCVKYLGQTITTFYGDGARSNWSTWVPLSGGKFQWCYQIQTPSAGDYGVNMSLQAYAQP